MGASHLDCREVRDIVLDVYLELHVAIWFLQRGEGDFGSYHHKIHQKGLSELNQTWEKVRFQFWSLESPY